MRPRIRDLKQAVEAGAFRDDLYYRLNVFTISIPPLRERKEDIPLLVDHFLAKHREAFKKKVGGVSEPALQRLMNYSWPGNVRELENALVRALVLCHSDCLEIGDLPEELSGEEKGQGAKAPVDKEELKRVKKAAQQKIKEEIEKNFILDALQTRRRKYPALGGEGRHGPQTISEFDQKIWNLQEGLSE